MEIRHFKYPNISSTSPPNSLTIQMTSLLIFTHQLPGSPTSIPQCMSKMNNERCVLPPDSWTWIKLLNKTCAWRANCYFWQLKLLCDVETTQSTCFSLPVYPHGRRDIRKLLSHGLSSALVMNLPINESFTQLSQKIKYARKIHSW